MYAFEGEVIKLKEKDFKKWQKCFPFCELELELVMLDQMFANEREEGRDVKKWYMTAMYKLRYRNDQLKQQQSNQPKSTFDQLTDRSWAEGMIDNVVKIGEKR